MHTPSDASVSAASLADALNKGQSFHCTLPAGLYEIHYRIHAPGFDPQSLFFRWQGQDTGPWDYAPSGPHNGECLLPVVQLQVNGGPEVKARVFIPRTEELEALTFHGRVGFRLKAQSTVTLQLRASLPATWLAAEIVAVDDFADQSLGAEAFKTDCLFFLNEAKIADLRANWKLSPWGQTVDRILDDCGRFAPPATLAQARQISSDFLKTREIYEDNVLLFGNYVASLALRARVFNDGQDHRQLALWVDALTALPIWGNSDDPHGRDHNNDLTADFHMAGLVLALNWNPEQLGQERTARMREKIRYQARQMLAWVTGSRSSWPGSATQNHAFFGFQTLLLAGAALLHAQPQEPDAEALDWLQIAARAFANFTRHLPEDGSYHEGLGYINFAMAGLMPSLFLLEQITGGQWLPHAWLAKHFEAIDTLLPADAAGGFWIDDGDAYLPLNSTLLLWGATLAPHAQTREAASGVLAKLRNLPPEKYLQSQWLLHNVWKLLLAPQATDLFATAPEPAEETWRHKLLPDAGYCVFRTGGSSRAIFQTAPPHGYKCFAFERHIYSYGHHHPDAGNVQLLDAGEWILADTGFTYRKSSEEHNVLLVNGHGQHNNHHVWMVPPPWDINPQHVQIQDGTRFTRARIELACFYPATLGLTSWTRSVCAAEGALVVTDTMTAKDPVIFTINWVAQNPWTADASGRYQLAKGWQLHTGGQSLNAIAEQLFPARRFNNQYAQAQWHALRLSNPTPAQSYRITSIFTHESCAIALPELFGLSEV